MKQFHTANVSCSENARFRNGFLIVGYTPRHLHLRVCQTYPSALPGIVRDVGTHGSTSLTVPSLSRGKEYPYPSELLNASISSIDSVSETSWKLISGGSCPRSMAFKIPRYRLD